MGHVNIHSLLNLKKCQHFLLKILQKLAHYFSFITSISVSKLLYHSKDATCARDLNIYSKGCTCKLWFKCFSSQ